jgi:lipopolysaccharide transport system permease protein
MTIPAPSGPEVPPPSELGGVWRIEPASSSIAGQLSAFWRYRSLFWPLTVRALFDIYRSTILGILWMVIRPLMIAVPAIFIVGNLFGISVAPLPLPLFILVGLAAWLFFRRSVQWFTKSMNKNRAILKRMYVPPLLLLIAAASPALFEFLVVAALVTLTGIYYAVQGVYFVDFGWHTLAVIPALAMCLLVAVAVGCFTSILNALARDTWLTMRYVLGFWMLATPVVYPMDIFPEQYRWIVYLNPLTPAVELFRWGVLEYGTVRWEYVGLSLAEIFFFLLLGLWFFGKQQNRLFDHR